MTVQDIINAVSNDVRQVLSPTAPDANIFIPWVDRIHKGCLHSGVYSYLLESMEVVSLAQGTSLYALAQVPRKIDLVYDRTFDRPIREKDAMAAGDTPSSSLTNSQWTEFYKRSGSNTLFVFPAPQKAIENATLEIHYKAYAPDLALLTDALLIPSDGIDVVVAGVNSLAFSYLKLGNEAATWTEIYKELKG